MTEYLERIAVLETDNIHHKKNMNDVVDKLDEIGKSVDSILLNLEGKSGFVKGMLFMCTIAASAFGGLVAWAVNRYYHS
jgi:hypothetical protein